jgi:hypothetical protein
LIDCNWLLPSSLGGPIFAGLRRALGAPGRAKTTADQGAGRAGVDQADRQPAATQPLTRRLSLASPSARPLAEPTLPLTYPAKPEAGQAADASAGEAAEQRLSGYQQVAGQTAAPDQAGQRLGDIASGVARQSRAGADWTIRLAASRAVAPNSVTGLSLLLGLCAAVWFSGGTRQDELGGLITTGAWVLLRAGARLLAGVTAQRVSQLGGHAGPVGRRRRRQPDHSDWLVLPGFDWTADDLPERSATGRESIGRARGQNFGWFYAVCSTAAECAIYGGIAAGAESAGWKASWPLAVAIVIVGSIAAIARACGASAQGAEPGQGDGQTTHLFGALGSLTFPAIGVRVLLTALITVGSTPRLALVAVLAAGVVALAGNLSRTGRRIAAGRRAAAASPAGRGAAVATQDMLLVCRDDGPLARRAGWLVRGNLMPVPPAVAGLVAIGLLTVLGIKNLPGIVALTPVVVMLLAAPGSSHPHDGRFDWLVPMLLCLAQYIYLAALGAAESVPWPVVFATCSMTAVWYASLVASRLRVMPDTIRPSRRKTRVVQIMARRTEGIGWEGRIGVVGLAGMFGIATFGYLGLTACLGALIGRKVFIDYLRQGEDQRQ